VGMETWNSEYYDTLESKASDDVKARRIAGFQ